MASVNQKHSAMLAAEQQLKSKYSVPEGLARLLEVMSREVILHNPSDINTFLANYLEGLLAGRDGKLPCFAGDIQEMNKFLQDKLDKHLPQYEMQYSGGPGQAGAAPQGQGQAQGMNVNPNASMGASVAQQGQISQPHQNEVQPGAGVQQNQYGGIPNNVQPTPTAAPGQTQGPEVSRECILGPDANKHDANYLRGSSNGTSLAQNQSYRAPQPGNAPEGRTAQAQAPFQSSNVPPAGANEGQPGFQQNQHGGVPNITQQAPISAAGQTQGPGVSRECILGPDANKHDANYLRGSSNATSLAQNQSYGAPQPGNAPEGRTAQAQAPFQSSNVPPAGANEGQPGLQQIQYGGVPNNTQQAPISATGQNQGPGVSHECILGPDANKHDANYLRGSSNGTSLAQNQSYGVPQPGNAPEGRTAQAQAPFQSSNIQPAGANEGQPGFQQNQHGGVPNIAQQAPISAAGQTQGPGVSRECILGPDANKLDANYLRGSSNGTSLAQNQSYGVPQPGNAPEGRTTQAQAPFQSNNVVPAGADEIQPGFQQNQHGGVPNNIQKAPIPATGQNQGPGVSHECILGPDANKHDAAYLRGVSNDPSLVQSQGYEAAAGNAPEGRVTQTRASPQLQPSNSAPAGFHPNQVQPGSQQGQYAGAPNNMTMPVVQQQQQQQYMPQNVGAGPGSGQGLPRECVVGPDTHKYDAAYLQGIQSGASYSQPQPVQGSSYGANGADHGQGQGPEGRTGDSAMPQLQMQQQQQQIQGPLPTQPQYPTGASGATRASAEPRCCSGPGFNAQSPLRQQDAYQSSQTGAGVSDPGQQHCALHPETNIYDAAFLKGVEDGKEFVHGVCGHGAGAERLPNNGAVETKSQIPPAVRCTVVDQHAPAAATAAAAAAAPMLQPQPPMDAQHGGHGQRASCTPNNVQIKPEPQDSGYQNAPPMVQVKTEPQDSGYENAPMVQPQPPTDAQHGQRVSCTPNNAQPQNSGYENAPMVQIKSEPQDTGYENAPTAQVKSEPQDSGYENGPMAHQVKAEPQDSGYENGPAAQVKTEPQDSGYENGPTVQHSPEAVNQVVNELVTATDANASAQNAPQGPPSTPDHHAGDTQIKKEALDEESKSQQPITSNQPNAVGELGHAVTSQSQSHLQSQDGKREPESRAMEGQRVPEPSAPGGVPLTTQAQAQIADLNQRLGALAHGANDAGAGFAGAVREFVLNRVESMRQVLTSDTPLDEARNHILTLAVSCFVGLVLGYALARTLGIIDGGNGNERRQGPMAYRRSPMAQRLEIVDVMGGGAMHSHPISGLEKCPI